MHRFQITKCLSEICNSWCYKANFSQFVLECFQTLRVLLFAKIVTLGRKGGAITEVAIQLVCKFLIASRKLSVLLTNAATCFSARVEGSTVTHNGIVYSGKTMAK